MIWQPARVVACDAKHLTLVFSRPESCQRCARGEGCGTGVFAHLFSRRKTRVVLPAKIAVSSGDWVRVGLEPRDLAMSAGLHYGLPLVGFLLGAMAGHVWSSGGIVADLAALAAGLAGFLLVAGFVARRLRPTLNPVVERLSCTASDTTSFFS